DVSTAIEEDTRWQAIITRVPIPQTPAQISRQWGSEGRDNLSVTQNADRDALIEELARAADQYEARDLRVQIESTIVEDAVALPLATQPTVDTSGRSISGVELRPGGLASLTSGVAASTVTDG